MTLIVQNGSAPTPKGGGQEGRRRRACPGLSAPMQTGDGLLVRLMPIGTIPLAALAKLCAAARLYGNGIMEITARGNIQVRGLSAASAPRFAAAVAALDLAAEDSVPVYTDPLAGLTPDEMLDSGKLAVDLRRAVTQRSLAARLSPKVSVAIDGGGALGLDQLTADVRLRAEVINGDPALEVSVGGDATNAATIGLVALAHGVETAVRLLDVIAQRGRDARARDIAREEPASFRAAISDLFLSPNKPSCPASRRTSTSYGNAKDGDGRNISERSDAVLRTAMPGHDAGSHSEVIGAHRLRGGLLAVGLAPVFGHADASSLDDLVEAAQMAGAAGIRTAPARSLIVIGLASDALASFTAAAERLGFIVRSDDPRRHVVACSGAPFCASGHIAARTVAPAVAEAVAQFRGDSFTIHVSGCAKGCAHSAPAALTISGTPDGCALIADGVARDAPFAVVGTNELSAAIAKHAHERTQEARHV
ncbi:MAG: precorrin-3B synthase [Xanthobacteraceae bacterium]